MRVLRNGKRAFSQNFSEQKARIGEALNRVTKRLFGEQDSLALCPVAVFPDQIESDSSWRLRTHNQLNKLLHAPMLSHQGGWGPAEVPQPYFNRNSIYPKSNAFSVNDQLTEREWLSQIKRELDSAKRRLRYIESGQAKKDDELRIKEAPIRINEYKEEIKEIQVEIGKLQKDQTERDKKEQQEILDCKNWLEQINRRLDPFVGLRRFSNEARKLRKERKNLNHRVRAGSSYYSPGWYNYNRDRIHQLESHEADCLNRIKQAETQAKATPRDLEAEAQTLKESTAANQKILDEYNRWHRF